MAKAAVALRDWEVGENEYRKAIQNCTSKEAELAADAKNNLAGLLVERRKGAQEAVNLVRQAISVRGERSSYLDTLARACDLAGDWRCASKTFEKLLGQNADLPPAVAEHARKRLAELKKGQH